MVNNHQMQYFYNYTAQNSSYNFNNSFYQNYVSTNQKQIAIKFRMDGGFSTAMTSDLPP